MAGLTIPGALAVAASVVAVIGATVGLYSWCHNLYRRSIGSRRDLARRFCQLATGINTRYVEERFGAPAFADEFHFDLGSGAVIKLTSLLYYTRHAWLQMLTNESDAVVRFSITVTDPRFRFQIRDVAFGNIEARLGHSHFSDVIPSVPDGRSLQRTVQGRRHYSEAYRVGVIADYQLIVLSYNDAGTGTFGSIEEVSSIPLLTFGDGLLLTDPGLDSTRNPELALGGSWTQQFRAQTVINTLTIFNSFYLTGIPGNYGQSAARLIAKPGPDSARVRWLAPDPRIRRKLRKEVL
jgi:hypothetical protein